MQKHICEVDLDDFCAAFDSKVKSSPEHGDSSRPDYELEALRHEGDQLFSVRDFVGAIQLYSQCIAQKPQIPATFSDSIARQRTLLLTYASRSESWLWLQKYESALHDAVRALEFDPLHVMSLFCKGRALHGLERYEEACASLCLALQQNPADEAIRDALTKAEVGYHQSHDGVYDLEDFLLSGCQGPAPSCSDFVGPVEIQYVPSAGRGLVVTKDVTAGELLLVSNALSVACSPTEFWAETRITKANHDFLVAELLDQVQNSKRRMAQLCTLASDPQDAMESPAMEAFLPELDWTCGEDLDSDRMDSARISGVIRMNAFDAIKCIDPIPFGDIETESNTGSDAGIASSGIWVLPSFINHSCASNCNKMFVGNAMFIRASRDIAAGEQLTLSYCDPYEPEDYRQDSLKWWKFYCKCERCLLEQTFENNDSPPSYLNFFSFIEKIMASEKPLTKMYRDHRKLVDNGQLHELTRIVDAVEHMIKSSVSKMEPRLQNWLRAPFIEAYTASILVHMSNASKKIEALERALDIMMAVGGGELVAMQISSTLLRTAKQLHGETSDEYRKTECRVMEVCTATLGKHSKEFYLRLIDARLNSENQAFG